MELSPDSFPEEFREYFRSAQRTNGQSPPGAWVALPGRLLRWGFATSALLLGALTAYTWFTTDDDFPLWITLPLFAGTGALLSRTISAFAAMRRLKGLPEGDFCDGATWWVIGETGFHAYDLSDAMTVQKVTRWGKNRPIPITTLEVHGNDPDQGPIVARDLTVERGLAVAGKFLACFLALVRQNPPRIPGAGKPGSPPDTATLAKHARQIVFGPIVVPDYGGPTPTRFHFRSRTFFERTRTRTWIGAAVGVFVGLLFSTEVRRSVTEARSYRAVLASAADDARPARDHLRLFPQGAHLQEVAREFEKRLFRHIDRTHDRDAAREYLAMPWAKPQAAAVQDLLEKEELEIAIRQESPAAFRAFLAMANNRALRESALREYDRLLFNAAVASRSRKALREYMVARTPQIRRSEALAGYEDAAFAVASAAHTELAMVEYVQDPLVRTPRAEVETLMADCRFDEAVRDFEKTRSTVLLTRFTKLHSDDRRVAEVERMIRASARR